tara:strand:- start:224 stop:760 length:537 start_codon:yes stop_codon:yes gene_type:complete
MTQIRFIFLTSALIVVGIFGCGCGGGKPNSVSSNISYGPDDDFATRILDRSEQREVISIMRSAVVGPTDDPAHPARYGVRWSDVRAAAIAAGSPLELAVLSLEVDSEDTMKTVELISIREVPVMLYVHRVSPPEIYTARVTAGLFDDDFRLAEDFLTAFNASMRNFGKKPGWPDLKNE